MQETITVTLPAQIKPALDEMGQREGASLDELITRAIEEYLFAHQFRLLRGTDGVQSAGTRHLY
jgi:hypothetical protein